MELDVVVRVKSDVELNAVFDLIPTFSRGEGAKTTRMILLPLLWRGLG
jgi:hypothetical protein